MYIYGNWSAYDELSDGVILTEELAMTQMSHLERLLSHGVRFDSYLMDAFWYDPSGAYRTWRKTTWPDGPDRWFEACHRNRLLPGLWFTANTLFHMELPKAWEDSIDEGGWGLCCFQGGFLEDFLESLDFWYRRGVRIFKLDFAEFRAVPKGLEGRWSPEEARALNIEAFQNGLKRFRQDHPEAVFMAFNGFDHRECMDRSSNPPGDYISPSWLDVFDSLYSGDPRPADLPGDFWRSVDFYADCMTRLFESSGVPLDRIDNCGFMAGPTGTCYWRGKANWQESLLLSLARGGNIHVAYGDLSLFTDEDARWWAKAQQLYPQGGVSFFGGWPGNGEWFGWHQEGIVTVANPGLGVQMPELPEGHWRLVTSNQGDDPAESGLWPGGIAVYASRPTSLPLPHIAPPPFQAVEFQSSDPDEHHSEVSFEEKGTCRLIVKQVDGQGQPVRTGSAEDGSSPMRVMLNSVELPPMFDKKIWSGISWSICDLECDGPTCVQVKTLETRPCRLTIEVLR